MTKNHQKINIGLLGGTFDPPHLGHLRISYIAIKRLKLDEIWWIVSLSNPLKEKEKVSSFNKRLEKAKKFVKIKKIIVTDLEKKINSPYTIDLICYLKKKYPWRNFVWIMGVDSVINFHNWKDWKEIFYKVPIAIFDRPFYSLSTSKSKALTYFKNRRISNKLSKKLKNMIPPRWVFITGQTHLKSSTQLRQEKIGLKKKY